ncbi:hypothetical protein BST95_07435 [Halioglobus japonicus]|uniref:Uncharacterized protein n=1 Tax=Halioglobus japonicus TaxID=930805 RepID=A0AAP8ME24_9GAMM|nr:hypothetical protein BST95_07435 [Halioglobus japonicus]PLW86091.1 hypothetical protein C0029_06480 [Halioglobus japonicus]
MERYLPVRKITALQWFQFLLSTLRFAHANLSLWKYVRYSGFLVDPKISHGEIMAGLPIG